MWTDDVYLGLVRLWKLEHRHANHPGPRSICDRIEDAIDWLIKRRRQKDVYGHYKRMLSTAAEGQDNPQKPKVVEAV